MSLILVCGAKAEVKLYDIYPNCFDYVFRGETITPDGKKMLTFEDLKYQKVIVGVGGNLRNLKVESYNRGDKTTKMNDAGDLIHVKPKLPSVTLATNDGKKLVLPLNKPVYFPGYLAKFVNTDTIEIQVAREDGVLNNGKNLCTVSLTSNEVVLTYGNDSQTYKPMTKSEKTALMNSIKEKKSANMVKALATYERLQKPTQVQLSEGYQEYRDFIFEQSNEQANQQPMDIQEFNTRRNDAKQKMSDEHTGALDNKPQPIKESSTSDSDYDSLKNDNY